MDLNFNFKEIFSAFMVLFAVIDITGSTPVIIGLKDRRRHTFTLRRGHPVLCRSRLDYHPHTGLRDGPGHRDIQVPGTRRLRHRRAHHLPAHSRSRSPHHRPVPEGRVPRREHHRGDTAQHGHRLFRTQIGKGGVYILRKFFGIILLAIAVKLFTTNIASLF